MHIEISTFELELQNIYYMYILCLNAHLKNVHNDVLPPDLNRYKHNFALLCTFIALYYNALILIWTQRLIILPRYAN